MEKISGPDNRMEGFILINKPKGITSFAVVQELRKLTGVRKIGHCGTLDPNATGLMICAIGRSATREIGALLKKDKTYIAEIELGKTSDTFDAEGRMEKKGFLSKPTIGKVKNVLKEFVGEQMQIPPIYSAKKIKGKKAYELARKGLEVTLKPQKIKINKITLISYYFPIIKLEVDCGSGTYIRTLAHDIGDKLLTGAYLKNLKRTRIADHRIEESIKLIKLNRESWEKHLFQIKK